MSKTFLKAFTFLAVAALVATASAGARDSRTITIGHSATVENGTLAAGNYIISWKSRSPEAGVTFQSAKDQGVVMTAHGRIEKRSDYFDRDMVRLESIQMQGLVKGGLRQQISNRLVRP